jgi:hypothetical protein
MEAFAIPDVRERLNEAVDALVGESIDAFSTHELGDDVVHLHRTIDRLEAELIRRLYRFHADHGAQAEGGGTTVSWLRRCGMTVKAAADRVHLARVLGELPASLDSARVGRASFGNVAMIGHLAKDVGVEQVQPFEDVLVGAAARSSPVTCAGSRRPPGCTWTRMVCSTLTIAPTSVAGSSASRPTGRCSSSGVSSMPKGESW